MNATQEAYVCWSVLADQIAENTSWKKGIALESWNGKR
jgi:hypothetical protein